MKADSARWYREPFVWLLVSLPLAAVVGGFVTLALAIHTDDGLVVDDYYRKGREINRVLARDDVALRLHIASDIEFDAERRLVRAQISGGRGFERPAQLHLRLMHATRGGFDREFNLDRTADGSYHGLLPSLPPGRWHVQLEAADWRLVGSAVFPGASHLAMKAGDPYF
jgi:hypothetical protein